MNKPEVKYWKIIFMPPFKGSGVVELCANRDIARIVLKFHKRHLADTVKFKIIKLKADKYVR